MNVHETPTHLDVPDHILLGLTLRHVLVLIAGVALGVWLGNSIGWPTGLVALAPILLATLALSFIRPAGRGLEEWLFVIAVYYMSPRLAVWRPGAGIGAVTDDAPRLVIPAREGDDS